MKNWQARFAIVLRNGRIRMDMSQEQLAEKIEKTTGFVGQVERGESMPSLETLQALVSCLGIDANMLFTEHSEPVTEYDEVRSLMSYMDQRKRALLLEFAKLLHKMEL